MNFGFMDANDVIATSLDPVINSSDLETFLVKGNDTRLFDTLNNMGDRTIQMEYVPLACGYESFYGLKMKARSRKALGAQITTSTRGNEYAGGFENQLIESVRYFINQDSSDFDEGEYNGHLRAPVSGKYQFYVEIFGSAQMTLGDTLVFRVMSHTETPMTFISKNITLEKDELYKINLKYEYYDHDNIVKVGDEARKPYMQKYGVLKVRWIIPDELDDYGNIVGSG
jgi:hypothetical protein